MVIVFLIFCFHFTSAQTLELLSEQNTRKKTGVSSLGTLGTDSKGYGYKRSLSNSAKEEIISSLSINEIILLFEKLDDADNQDLFGNLSAEQKRGVFVTLSDNEKQRIFRTLNDEDKVDLFTMIDDKDRIVILSNLGYIDKSRLINALSAEEKRSWIEKYPELASLIELKKDEFYEKGLEEKEEEKRLSRLEEIFSGQFPSGIDREILQFGYDFFMQKSPFLPEKNVPVGSEYHVGPGDSFTVNLWGNVEEVHYATISRDGTVTLPRLGTLPVSGLTFSELKEFLYNKFREYYPDFKMNITMDTLKSIDIFMAGELNNPGTYSLSGLSTIVSALYASGGPSKNGTLRNINILNNGKFIKTIDLYDFFINGAKSDDITLKQGYTVFVPVIGPTVAVSGHVKRPAIYEIKEDQTLEQIIEFAGGLLPTSHLNNVIVERIVGQKGRVIVSFDIDPSNEKTAQN
ncbi:MAG: hypothetical protein GX846_00285, partial [Deltaproteobacteria bacterium]|nr:hypothetical protein [Deltaproteobacteria bacterium]